MRSGLFITALAAPVALAASPAMAATPGGDTMSGFYVGGHVGYARGSTDWAGPPNPLPAPGFTESNTADLDPNGFIGGLTAGGRWQSGYVVLGVEGQASFGSLEDSAASTSVAGVTNTTEIDWMGSVTAQFGIQTGKVHAYLEVGVGFTGSEYSIADTNGVAPNTSGSVSDTRSGVVFGGGFEYLLDSHWSVRGEYNYLTVGSNDYVIGGQTWAINQTTQTFTLGVNYRF